MANPFTDRAKPRAKKASPFTPKTKKKSSSPFTPAKKKASKNPFTLIAKKDPHEEERKLIEERIAKAAERYEEASDEARVAFNAVDKIDMKGKKILKGTEKYRLKYEAWQAAERKVENAYNALQSYLARRKLLNSTLRPT